MAQLSVNGARLWSRLMEMADIGATAGGGSHRLALSDEDMAGRALLLKWCETRGYEAEHDQMGNLFIRRAGGAGNTPPIAIGSHLDTQPMGGRFDGVLGVLAGLEVLETLDDAGVTTAAPVDLICWTNEEGSRFQPAMMGAGVYMGALNFDAAKATRDASGVTVGEELARHGFDSGLVPGAREVGEYLELHIEQGPILERAGAQIGAVTTGQGVRWYEAELRGQETHAGPSPMQERRDPMPALARVIDLVYEVANSSEPARGTIGVLGVSPCSINVMAGKIALTVDLRHPDEAALAGMDAALRRGFKKIGAAHPKISAQLSEVWHSEVVRFDGALTEAVRASAAARGFESLDMISGAGHDACHMARVVPSALVFVPCKDGLSHNEAEYCAPEDALAGANVLLDLVLARARQSGT